MAGGARSPVRLQVLEQGAKPTGRSGRTGYMRLVAGETGQVATNHMNDTGFTSAGSTRGQGLETNREEYPHTSHTIPSLTY